VEIQKIEAKYDSMPYGITYYFIGQPKTRKTTVASSWSEKGQDGVVILDTDLGSDFVEGANVIPITSLVPPTREVEKNGKKITENGRPVIEEVPPVERGYFYRTGEKRGQPMPVYSMREAYIYLTENWQKLGFDTIVIDTLGEVNRWIEDMVASDMGIGAMGEGPFGADWGRARRKNLDVVLNFQRFVRQVGGNLILTSHSKNTIVTEGKVQLGPELPKGLGNALTAKADVIGSIQIPKGNEDPVISFVAFDERTIGSRLRPLAGKRLPFNYEAIKAEILAYKEK